MPDLTFNQFPISGKIVDFDQLQTDVNNLNANAVLESRTINGLDLSQNRVLKSAQFSYAMTGEYMLAGLTYTTVSTW